MHQKQQMVSDIQTPSENATAHDTQSSQSV